MTNSRKLALTGQIGLAAAVLVGIGEFLLHHDAEARYTSTFAFFEGVTRERATIGHFFGVLGAPLYLVGVYHIYLMLRPANEMVARVACLVMAYGFVVGDVWIGSRSTAGELVNTIAIPEQLDLYVLRYESLLQIVRVAALLFSGMFIWLCLTGRSLYPRAMALLNPVLLIALAFVIFFTVPAVGQYIMPIALNVAFFVLFATSLVVASRLETED
ncbi:hypothetical protein N9H93_00510 [Rhizobiaceae bacterium]|nr:hypothetical protein [Rhizobiaceae bacterium]